MNFIYFTSDLNFFQYAGVPGMDWNIENLSSVGIILIWLSSVSTNDPLRVDIFIWRSSTTCICYKQDRQGILPWGRGHWPLEAVNPHWHKGRRGLRRLVTSPLPLISPPLSIVVPSQYLSMQSTGGRYNLSVEENLHVSRIFQRSRLFGSSAICGWTRCSCTCDTVGHTVWGTQWNTRSETESEIQDATHSETPMKHAHWYTAWNIQCDTPCDTQRDTQGAQPINWSLPAKLCMCANRYKVLSTIYTHAGETHTGSKIMWSTDRQGCIGHKWCVEFMVEMCIQTKVKSSSIDKWSVNNVPQSFFFCQTVAAGAAEPADVQLKLTMRTPRRCTLHQTLLCWHSPYCVVGGGDPP